MGIKQIPLKIFKKFLKYQGLEHIRNNHGHEIWDNPKKPLSRPVTLQGRYKNIPPTHIHTNLLTLGISHEEFTKWMNS